MLVHTEGKSQQLGDPHENIESSPRFTGQDPEPRASLSSGHMPHARPLPFNTLIQKSEKGYTTFLPQDKLKQVFEGALGDGKDRPIVAVSRFR